MARSWPLGDALHALVDGRRDTPFGGDDARLAFVADERQRGALDELDVAAAAGGQGAPGGAAVGGNQALCGVAVVADDVGGDGMEGDGGGHDGIQSGMSLRWTHVPPQD